MPSHDKPAETRYRARSGDRRLGISGKRVALPCARNRQSVRSKLRDAIYGAEQV